MEFDQEIQKSIDKIIEIERQRARIEMLQELLSEVKGNRYKRPSRGFPFDLLETVIRDGLSLMERSVKTGVDVLFDLLQRLRQR
ncbi:MAG: hypothetical protein ABI690_29610 [Chloroflexota bacterium]